MANRLQFEQSLYLQQHAHNPVDWYPWGDEAFRIAADRQVPVLVSIGYAACHWCHVMERESFEDAEVAAFMNANFVCVKVDREERPEVDHIYMDAVTSMTGSGGWPLNVFVTPGKLPFYGGTYFPPRPAYNRPSWIQVLNHMTGIWVERRDDVESTAGQLADHLKQISTPELPQTSKAIDKELCLGIAESMLKNADGVNGGFGGAPKFPGTMATSFLLEHYLFTGDSKSLNQAVLNLDAMANGGIYDQLGGGFARYSTDNKWLAPHFEKMLYDNALLILAYCDGYSIAGNKRYATIIKDTIAFVERELKDPSGVYYCALDADSEGHEGLFYTFTWQDWCAAVTEHRETLSGYFGVTEEGNWEETNILHVAVPYGDQAEKFGMVDAELTGIVDRCRKHLFEIRSARVRPATDDKCLLSWNALMNMALTKAGLVLAEPGYLKLAEDHMDAMMAAFSDGNSYYHVWKGKAGTVGANLDDMAYLVQAMFALAAAKGENGLTKNAIGMVHKITAAFGFPDSPFFYFTPKDNLELPVRKLELYDGATPSGNAVMAHNLILAGLCSGDSALTSRASEMLTAMADKVSRYGTSFGYWALQLQRYAVGMRVVVCTGANAIEVAKEISFHKVPQAYFVASYKEIYDPSILKGKYFGDKTHIFVCSQDSCLPLVGEISQAVVQIGNGFENRGAKR